MSRSRLNRRCLYRLRHLQLAAAGLPADAVVDHDEAVASLTAAYAFRRTSIIHEGTDVRLQEGDRVRGVITIRARGSRELLELAPHCVEVHSIAGGLAEATIELVWVGRLDRSSVGEWSLRETTKLATWVNTTNEVVADFSGRVAATAQHAVAKRREALATLARGAGQARAS